MTGEAVPTATPRADVLLDEVTRLRAELAEAEDLVRWYAAELHTAQRAYAERVFAHAAELDQLRAELAARPVPLHRLVLVGASSLMTLAVGLVDGTDCRRCGHPRYLHRHHRPGTDCSCGCRAWTLWGRRG